MSGLCGWMRFGTSQSENRELVERMARPLTRFDGSSVRCQSTSRSAIAVAVKNHSGDIYQRENLLVAINGQAKFSAPHLIQKVHSNGLAKTFAEEWQANGPTALAQMSGAFALCILDETQGEAVLAIDRMGTHPLTYQVTGETLAFGTSADALSQHPLTPPEIDPQSIYNYVYFHMVPSPGTIHKNQHRLLPGEYLTFKKGRAETHKYWHMNFQENEKGDFEELKQQFLQVLRTSVAEATGGQKVGAFLSGGTDSSTITGILGQVTGEPARTYSIGFAAEGYDETEYARIAVRHFSTDHHEYYVTPDDVVTAIPQIAAVCDQPFGNASAVPAYYCARMAKADGLERILGGDGGDELFGGNERYAKQTIFSFYEQIPSALREGILKPAVFGMPGGGQIKLVRKARSYIEQASVPMPARLETYNLLERYGHTQVFTTEFLEQVDTEQPLRLLTETYGRTEAQSLINRMLALDWKFTLADNDLPKVMKACELAGMEVVFPFLNDSMVAFSARLAPQLKLKGTKLRYFFKEALRDTLLPEEIINKQKHGFGLPFGVWLKDHKPLRDLAAESLSDLRLRKIVRPGFIEKLLGEHMGEHAGYHGTMVWVLMMLEQWYKEHSSKALGPSASDLNKLLDN